MPWLETFHYFPSLNIASSSITCHWLWRHSVAIDEVPESLVFAWRSLQSRLVVASQGCSGGLVACGIKAELDISHWLLLQVICCCFSSCWLLLFVFATVAQGWLRCCFSFSIFLLTKLFLFSCRALLHRGCLLIALQQQSWLIWINKKG